ncbi:hypothetical protein SDC9_207701 [bioreactor metagenome]|uniref:Uncharacterized protein n=1 Tax=bioreactor metagenome TaxID=1076179 RepID=A0A645J8H2_9ZZZZ
MLFSPRRVLICKRQHTHVCDYKSVGAVIVKPFKICGKALRLAVSRHGIYGDMNAHAVCVPVLYRAFKFFAL